MRESTAFRQQARAEVMDRGDIRFYCTWCKDTVTFDGTTLRCPACGVLKPHQAHMLYANEEVGMRGKLCWHQLHMSPSRRVLDLMKRPRTLANRIALHEAIFNPPRPKPRTKAERDLLRALDDIALRAGLRPKPQSAEA